jgi:3-deoxy-D-manno-octulosonic-acid transferase
MRYLYSFLFYCAVPLIFVRLWWRARLAQAYGKRWKERFAFIDLPVSAQRGLWVHAVSVGEVLAAVPLVKAIRQRYPDLPIVMTTMTPTGSARVQANFNDTVYHFYVPYDLPAVVHRFLKRVQPCAAMILETELWPNIFHQCKKRNIPLMLANARLSERSAQGYGKIKSLTKEMLSALTILGAHAKIDAERFIQLGMDPPRVHVTGSIKFEITVPTSILEQGEALRRFLGLNRPIWIAASTHEGEEEQILDAHRKVLSTLPNALLVLTPRHPERFERIVQLAKKRGFVTVSRSSGHTCSTNTQVFVGDTMGELMLFFAAVDVAFIGGSLVPNGGHNLLEPAALGVAALTGPATFNFADITRMLLDAHAAIQIQNSDELAEQVIHLLQHSDERSEMGERGREVIEQNRGALAANLVLIEELLDKK